MREREVNSIRVVTQCNIIPVVMGRRRLAISLDVSSALTLKVVED
jgi:hypothetical protein